MTFAAMVIDVDQRAVGMTELPDDAWLDTVRGCIGCETVEAHIVWFDGVRYLVFCDEEGRLRDDPLPCLFNAKDECEVVGSVVITGCRDPDTDDVESWEPRSMTDDELENLLEHLTGYLCHRRDGIIAFAPVLRGMSWTPPAAGEE